VNTLHDDAPEERARVYGILAPLIMAFHVHNAGKQFHIEDLRRYVLEFAPSGAIAPDSPGRILREMRLEGKLNYVVLNRRQSLYQFREVLADVDQAHN